MSYVVPDAHKLDLRAALEAEGWRIEREESASDAWWMNKLWRLEATWRPVGAKLYVSFLGDPQDEHQPSRRVSDVGVGPIPARSWQGDGVERFPLHPDWPTQLRHIIDAAARLRDEL